VLSLKERWAGFTRGDRIVLLVAELAVFAACIALFVTSTPAGDDTVTVAGIALFVFLALQFVLLLIILSLAASRKHKTLALAKPAVSTKQKATSWGYGLLFWLACGVVYMVGGYAAEWTFPDSELATKWRYGLDDDLKNAEYVMPRRPHDCEFMTAPLGAKHCHYDKEIATVRVRKAQSGARIISYDEGKTWEQAVAVKRPTVIVSWTKVNE